MKNVLQNLLKVKSIVTIVLTGVFSFLAIMHYISPEMFMTIFTVIIAFYFGTQTAKKETEKEEKDEDKTA